MDEICLVSNINWVDLEDRSSIVDLFFNGRNVARDIVWIKSQLAQWIGSPISRSSFLASSTKSSVLRIEWEPTRRFALSNESVRSRIQGIKTSFTRLSRIGQRIDSGEYRICRETEDFSVWEGYLVDKRGTYLFTEYSALNNGGRTDRRTRVINSEYLPKFVRRDSK